MIQLLSLFSGIGAFEKALERLQIPFEVVNYCEIDKYASKAYSLIHGISEKKNVQDVTKIDCKNIQFGIDFLTYGFPCQDISCAGLQKGLEDIAGNKTRSGLFFDALRIIKETRPKIAICENVKALTSKKFTNEFKTVLDGLTAAGYKNYWQVLNSKDYGIPQNRERVFIVSIRDDLAHGFTFPAPFPLEYRLKDFLEINVEKKHFIDSAQISEIIKNNNNSLLYDLGYGFEKRKTAREYNDIMPAITARDFKQPRIINQTQLLKTDRIIQIGNIIDDSNINFKNPQRGRVYDIKGIAPTINTMTSGGTQPKIIEDATPPRIRKITPKECYKLMGFDDRDADVLIANKFSDTQLYKTAGNSIVVNVLQYLFSEIFKQYGDVFESGQQIGFMDLFGE